MIDLQIAFLEIFSFCLDFKSFRLVTCFLTYFVKGSYCVELMISNLWKRRF